MWMIAGKFIEVAFRNYFLTKEMSVIFWPNPFQQDTLNPRQYAEDSPQFSTYTWGLTRLQGL